MRSESKRLIESEGIGIISQFWSFNCDDVMIIDLISEVTLEWVFL